MTFRSTLRRTATALVIAAALGSPAGAKKRKPEIVFATPYPTAAATAPATPTGSIFQPDQGYAGLYEGWRARRVGDPLTIVLVERTAASKSASSKLDSTGGASVTPPTTGALSLFKKTDASISDARNFNGAGSADQANSLSGEVSVTVAEVYPNGTMLVQGQKSVTLNRGEEFVRIKGLVRIADIGPDNRVLSTRVADAQIAYTGKGDVARAGRQGWLGRFFSVVAPF